MSDDLLSDLRDPDVGAGTPVMVMRRQAADEIVQLQVRIDAGLAVLCDCYQCRAVRRALEG